MHTLLILISLALALGGSLLCVGLLRVAHAPSSRHTLQLTGLLLPALVLGLLGSLLIHFFSQICFRTAPSLDIALTQSLFALGALGISVAVGLNLLRAALLPWHLRRRTWDAPAWLQAQVAEVGGRVGLRRPPAVRVAADARPWALVAGLFRPHLVVSSGLVALLDREELGAVLYHELLHIRRGDLWWTVGGGVLRDLTWFLPSTRRLYAQLRAEQEVACDDGVPGARQRLALASALARVWQAALVAPQTPRGALALAAPEHEAPWTAEARVRRLLEQPETPADRPPYRTLLAVAALLGLFVSAQLGAATLAMDKMACELQQFLALPF